MVNSGRGAANEVSGPERRVRPTRRFGCANRLAKSLGILWGAERLDRILRIADSSTIATQPDSGIRQHCRNLPLTWTTERDLNVRSAIRRVRCFKRYAGCRPTPPG